MNSLVVFALLLAHALANPLYSVDPTSSNDWQLVPDGDGHLHLVDVNAQAAITPHFNAFESVQIILYTRYNRNDGRHIYLNNVAQLRASPFNPLHPTRFIIHGWNNDRTSRMNQLLRNTYLDRGNFNVFVVDWGAGAHTDMYTTAQRRVGQVGQYVAQFCEFIAANGATWQSITAVGHSLGAHVAGFAGKNVRGGRIQNIVALDPAGPLFFTGQPQGRVDIGDGVYVEVHHTDMGRLALSQPIGHASFYPNWGRGMPGCGTDLAGWCGHSRAWEYFAETIPASNGFWSTRCAGFESIQQRACPSNGVYYLMGGEPLIRTPNGVYFVETRDVSPFALGRR